MKHLSIPVLVALMVLMLVIVAVPGAQAQGTQPPVIASPAVSGTATPSQPGPLPGDPERYTGPEQCVECHASQVTAWENAPHANASKVQAFLESWQGVESPRYCLACHTTGYDGKSGSYVLEGVTCESCHEPFVKSHPDAPITVKDSSEACGTCHVATLKEWAASTHATAGVECADCHDPHGMNIRVGEAGETCGQCHSEISMSFSHAPQGEDGPDCVDCHIGEASGGPIEGHSYTGHTFEVSTQACAKCHAEGIHTMQSSKTEQEQEPAQVLETENQSTTYTDAPLALPSLITIALGGLAWLGWNVWHHRRV